MPTQHRLTDIALKAGEPWGHAPVRITLTDLHGHPVAGHVVGGDGALVKPFTFHADPVTGAFRVDLWANADITPSPTYYTVKIGALSWLIDVTGDGSLLSLQAVDPGPLEEGAASTGALAAEVAARVAADADLQAQIDGGGGGGGGAVDSVNGQTGVVVLDAADVGALATTGVDLSVFASGQFTIEADGSLTLTVGGSGDTPTTFAMYPTGDSTWTAVDNVEGHSAEFNLNPTGLYINIDSAGFVRVATDDEIVNLTNLFGALSNDVTAEQNARVAADIELAADMLHLQRRRVQVMHSLWSKLAGATPGIVQWEGGSNVHGEGGGLTGVGSMVDVTRLEFANWIGRPDPGLGWVPAFSYSAEIPAGNFVFRYGLGFTTASTGALPSGCTLRGDCGLGGWALEVAASGQTATHTQAGLKYIKVYLTAKKTGGGSAQLFVDGNAIGSPISTTDGSIAGTTDSGRITITWTGTGSTFFVRETGGANSIIVDGADIDTNAAPIVQQMNGGHGGQDVTNFLASSTTQHSVNNPADLYVASWGLNYYFNNGPTPDPAAMLTAVKAWVDERHAAAPQAGFLFDEQWYGGIDSAGKVPPSLDDWLTIWHGVIRDAVSYCDSLAIPAMTFSTYELWGDLYNPQPTPADPLSLLASDKLHPNVRAYRMSGRLTAQLMLPGASPTTFLAADGTGKMTGNVDLNGNALTDTSSTPLIRFLKQLRVLMPTNAGVMRAGEANDGVAIRPVLTLFANASDENANLGYVSIGSVLSHGGISIGEPGVGTTTVLYADSATLVSFRTVTFAYQAIKAKSLDLDVDASTSSQAPRLSQVVAKTLVDAKGDLLTATADDTPARLAVGANGRTLQADSSQSTGLAWVQPVNPVALMGPTGCLSETIPGGRTAAIGNLTTLTSGILKLALVGLMKGQVVTSISFVARTQALVTGTHQWFALFDSNRVCLAVTGDDLATAWAANSPKTLNLTSPFTILTTGAYYVGLMVAATTVPSLAGVTNATNVLTQIVPAMGGDSSTGQTTPFTVGATAGALTVASAGMHYGWVA